MIFQRGGIMTNHRASQRNTLILSSCVALGAVIAACGSSGGAQGAGGDGGADGRGRSSDARVQDGHGGGSPDSMSLGHGGDTGDGNGSTKLQVDADFPCDGCGPFPPASAPTCSAATLAPPTLVYPPDGVLLPPNMNVLEVQWVPPAIGSALLYEVDFSNSITEVRVETPCNEITSVRGVPNVGCGLTLSQTAWNDIAHTNADGDPVKVTVRATTAAGSCVTSSPESVSINFAEENLSGGIYYWQSATYGGFAGTTGGIYYHDFGTFDPTPTPFWTSGATGTCVGCHTLSKDGVMMELMNDDPDADDEFGDVHTDSMTVQNRTIVGAGSVSPGFQTLTHDHKYMIASTFKAGMGMMGPGGGSPDESFAVWTSDGNTLVVDDPLPSGMQGTQPNLSTDDKTVVFVSPTFGSISSAGDHHFLGGSLWKATFDETSGAMSGFSAFLKSTGMESFYYPDQSVDGSWVLFNENNDTSAANNDGDCFYSRQALVKLLHFPPQSGDVPLELTNLNLGSGMTNSWPRWSPVVQTYKNHQILWVTFSSNRDYGLHLTNTGFDNYYPPESPSYDQPQPASKQGVTFDNYAAPQIWMAAVIIDANRSLDSMDRSYPAFWLPFQDVTAHNHSAQWVATVVSTSPGGDGGVTGGDGGVTDGGDAGASGCGEEGAVCGGAGETCCTDVICCEGSCAVTCAK
jgi:hypothetical protein